MRRGMVTTMRTIRKMILLSMEFMASQKLFRVASATELFLQRPVR
jgi:hypothetical protein